jgi:hypothetical protein
MDSRFYIPISNSLRATDAQPQQIRTKDAFTFSFSCRDSNPVSFTIYKSLASFLSNKAFQQLKSKENTLTINCESIQLTPQEVKNELIHLLSGKPIIINQSNFEIFQEVFDQLENADFNLYFNKKVPELPTEFYLSIHSLKDILCPFYESKVQQLRYDEKHFFEIPIGICRLYFPVESAFFAFNNNKITLKQFQEGIQFLVHFSRGYFSIPTPNQMKFAAHYQFNPPAFESYFIFFFPGFLIIDKLEKSQQTIILLENNISELSQELSRANERIDKQTKEILAKEDFIQQEALKKIRQEEAFENQITKLIQNHESQIESVKISLEKEKQANIQREIIYKNEQIEFENQIKTLKKNYEAQIEIIKMSFEQEKIALIQQDKMNKKKQNDEFENQIKSMNQYYENQIQMLQQKIEEEESKIQTQAKKEMNALKEQFENERKYWQNIIQQFQNKSKKN